MEKLVNIDKIKDEICDRANDCKTFKDALIMISDVLKEVEDKAVSANEAEWVVRDNLDEDNVYICCSNCTMTFTFDKDEVDESFKDFNFCPYCGAPMKNPNGEDTNSDYDLFFDENGDIFLDGWGDEDINEC